MSWYHESCGKKLRIFHKSCHARCIQNFSQVLGKMLPLERENKHMHETMSHKIHMDPYKKTIRYPRDANMHVIMWTGLERRTYIFSERGDVELDGLHIDPSVVDSPNLYLSLFLMIPSSLSLINLILLERSRRTTTWVVKLAKKLKVARLQLGNLQEKNVYH